MSAPKKFKSALKKLCDRAKSALNSQARISSPANVHNLRVDQTLIMALHSHRDSDTQPQ